MIKQSLKREPSLYLEIRCRSTLATDFFFIFIHIFNLLIMGKRKITKRHIESEELRKGFEILEETKFNLLHEMYSIN